MDQPTGSLFPWERYGQPVTRLLSFLFLPREIYGQPVTRLLPSLFSLLGSAVGGSNTDGGGLVFDHGTLKTYYLPEETMGITGMNGIMHVEQ